jgi:hypothetical protein
LLISPNLFDQGMSNIWIPVKDGNGGSFRMERFYDGSPDSLGTSGYNRNLSLDFEVHFAATTFWADEPS